MNTNTNENKVVGYYQLDDEGQFFAIVLKDFWDENGFLDSDSSEEAFVPDKFGSVTEAIYDHGYATNEEAIAALEKAGFVAKDLN